MKFPSGAKVQRPQGGCLTGVTTEQSTQVTGAKGTGEGGEVREVLRGLVEEWREFGFYSVSGSHCAYRNTPETVS